MTVRISAGACIVFLKLGDLKNKACKCVTSVRVLKFRCDVVVIVQPESHILAVHFIDFIYASI